MATQLDTAVLDGLAGDLDTGYGAFVRAHSARSTAPRFD